LAWRSPSPLISLFPFPPDRVFVSLRTRGPPRDNSFPFFPFGLDLYAAPLYFPWFAGIGGLANVFPFFFLGRKGLFTSPIFLTGSSTLSISKPRDLLRPLHAFDHFLFFFRVAEGSLSCPTSLWKPGMPVPRLFHPLPAGFFGSGGRCLFFFSWKRNKEKLGL